MSNNIGKVVQVIGPVVDVRFASEADLPAIYNAINITGGEGDQKIDMVVEVMQHLGDDVVRCSAVRKVCGVYLKARMLTRARKTGRTGRTSCGGGVGN